MLIIYGALNLGGIETFFVRIAKERYLKGENTKIIFTIPKNKGIYNKNLYNELSKYCEIYHFEDVFTKIFLNWRFHLAHKLNFKKLSSIFSDCNYIHVADAYSGLIANIILKKLKKDMPITFGVYHTMEYSWGDAKRLPYFERINRKFIYENNSTNNLICFSNDTKKILENRIGKKLTYAQTFRLGVIETSSEVCKPKKANKEIRVCAVGRLTDFKTYNLWLPDIIKSLREKGYSVILDIYGDGESQGKIKEIVIRHSNYVRLFPAFDYSNFSSIVSSYDLFVGSGTAIIEASSLGVPSIIGIESISRPLTYGFFCDYALYEYNVMGLPFELKEVESYIESFINLESLERKNLSIRHKEAAEIFKISTCNENFQNMKKMVAPYFKLNTLLYYFSRFLFYKKIKFFKKTIYHDFI